MTSTLSWLDHSEQERRRALDVISLFREQGTVDELGIGTVRDAFADLFFPGISTIQTRAAYFLFIPWGYQQLERDIRLNWPLEEVARRARVKEIDLIGPMIRAGQTDGLIGREARSRLQRLPSTIYWGGLGTFGIRWFPGSQDAYHRSLTLGMGGRTRVRRDDDGEPLPGEVTTNWDPGLPTKRDGFPWEAASFALSRDEARYLRSRIVDETNETVRDSLLAWLLRHASAATQVDFPWEHPALGQMPNQLQEALYHARCFSEVMQGAQLLYNLMVAEGTERDDWVKSYRTSLTDWSAWVRSDRTRLREWWNQRSRFRQITIGAGHRPSRDLFIDTWTELALSGRTAAHLRGDPVARRLIRDREAALKGPRARLSPQGSLKEWGGDSGSRPLVYRWPNAQRILNDIFRGLRRHA